MIRRLSLAAVALAALAGRPAVAADEYVVDNSHTAVIFSVKHMNFSYTFGRFNKVEGKYTLDNEKPENSQFQVVIHVDSIDTNNPQRDGHLKNADFFNAGEFPLITFKSTKVAAKQEGDKTIFDVTGDLTMHGVTKPVTVSMEKLGEGQGPGPMGYRSGFVFATNLKRSDFGMTYGLDMVGDDVTVNVSFEGVRQGAPAAQ
jgi:polyisoprenoid-binding protein YceI